MGEYYVFYDNYLWFVCVCVHACERACVRACVCYHSHGAVLLISTLELNYEQLYHGILFIFNSWNLSFVQKLCRTLRRLRRGAPAVPTYAHAHACRQCNVGVARRS